MFSFNVHGQHWFLYDTCIETHFHRYDSLAAELREKLGGRQPLLLPPRDYDTMHRSRGNVVGSEERKSLNPRVVGSTAVANGSRDLDSSGKSSGIGSEEGELVNAGNSSPLDDAGFLPDQDDRSSSGNSSEREKSSSIVPRTTLLSCKCPPMCPLKCILCALMAL